MYSQSYEQALKEIHSRNSFSSHAGLSRISLVMNALGNPQNQFSCIHIAGTNGKGSVSAMVESVLRKSGYRVGLFTSPHMIDFRERIQVNRQMIPEHQLVDIVNRVCSVEGDLVQSGMDPLNEFELITAIGFTAFSEAQVDFAVIEVGLGGRFDATNVISHPSICAITPISLDHTDRLGNTLAEIAIEKAGIFRPSCPVVLSPQEAAVREVLLHQAELLGCPVIEAEEPVSLSADRTGQKILYRGHPVNLPLLGKHQSENAASAWEICRLLGLQEETICAGLADVFWPGRLQLLPGEPEILIDSCHNPAGAEALAEALDTLFRGRTIVALMAMMQDKDYKSCISILAPRVNCLIAATMNMPRSLLPEELAEAATGICRTVTAGSFEAGIALAQKAAPPDALLLICGSVYAAGAALQLLSQSSKTELETGEIVSEISSINNHITIA